MENQEKATRKELKVDLKNMVQPVPFGHTNIYFIETASGHILVDAGMPGKEKELDKTFETFGIQPNHIHLIIATHGHLDHVGSIAHAKKVSGGQILCHWSAAKYLEKGEAEPATPKNLKGRLLNFLTSLSGFRFEGTTPDILIDDEYDLEDFGIAGRVLHTPGHSPSSVSILLDNGECLIGDMVREAGSGQISVGMFYENKARLLISLEKVVDYEPRIIYLSHGTTIDIHTLRTAISANR
jgi:glyoxylase-like metal-dependent hydrolase (beta-lactamase superfamily II)